MMGNRKFWIISVALATVVTLVFSSLECKKYVLALCNGKTKECSKCPPGYFFEEHCTEDNFEATCNECPHGTFTPNYNLAHKCEDCSEACKQPEEKVKKNCTKTSDIVCECREGYFREPGPHGRCRPRDVCPPGQGVKKQGRYFM